MPNISAMPNSAHICLGVCTYQRPQMLLRCLLALRQLAAPEGTRLSIIIVDNEAEPACADLLDGMDGSLHYVHEPRRGIPMARNAILDKAASLSADWIAMLDDDQMVSSVWLTWMWWAAQRCDAAVVYGVVERLLPVPAPRWAFEETPRRRWDMNARWVPTNGVLFRANLADAFGVPLRFDERLALTGGEDRDFFSRAYGVRMVKTPEAISFETVPASRLTFRAQVARVYAEAMVATRQNRGHAKELPRTMLRGVLAIAVSPVAWLFARHAGRKQFLKGTKHMARVAGMVAGLLPGSAMPQLYRTIHGG